MRTFEWEGVFNHICLGKWSVRNTGMAWAIYHGTDFIREKSTRDEAMAWVEKKLRGGDTNIAPTTRLTPRQVDSLARQLAQHRDASAQLAELVALADNAPALNGLGKILTGWLPGRAPGPWPLTPEDTARAAMHGLIAHLTDLRDETARDLAQFVDLTEPKGETHDQN